MLLLGILALCAPLAAAPKVKKEGKSEEETPPEVAIDGQKELLNQAKIYLKRGYHLEETLKSLSTVKALDVLVTENIITEIFNCLDTPTINKEDRSAMLEFLLKRANPKDEHGLKIIKDLLSRVKKIRSPAISAKMLEGLFKLKYSLPEAQLNEIVSLQNDILEELTLPVTQRKFNHPDVLITLKNLKQSNDAKSKRLLLKIYSNVSSQAMAQVLRTEILKTMAELSLTDIGKEPYFSKGELREVGSTLVALLKSAKDAFLKPESLVVEDINEIKQLLLLAENILSNPDIERSRSEAVEQVIGLLRSHEPDISKLAGECLLHTKIIESEYNLKGLDLAPVLLENVKSRKSDFDSAQKMLADLGKSIEEKKAKGEAIDENQLVELKKMALQIQKLNHIGLELLTRYGSILIRASQKEPQASLVSIFEQLKNSFNEQKDFSAKKICLVAFSNLDIDLLNSRYFPKEALAVLDDMFNNGIAVLSIELKNEELDKLKESIIKVMSDCTGLSFTQQKEWSDWKRGPLGEKFFKGSR